MYIYTCACVYIFTYIYYMCMWADNDVPTDQLKEQTKHLWSDNSREWWHLCQVCPCAYTCIYMYVCVHIYMLLYVRVYTCLMTSVSGLSMCVYMYIYVCMCTYIHVIVCACVYMFIYIHYILMRKQIMTNWSTTRKKDSPVIWKIASVDDDIRVRYV